MSALHLLTEKHDILAYIDCENFITTGSLFIKKLHKYILNDSVFHMNAVKAIDIYHEPVSHALLRCWLCVFYMAIG